METILILAALAACAVAALTVAVTTSRGARAPLRLSNEPDEADEAILLHGIARDAVPIDRDADILDLEPVHEHSSRRRGEAR